MKVEYMDKAYFEGEFVDFKDAKVSVATNALQYGIALFGGVKGYKLDDGRFGIFRLDDHIERLQQSARTLRFKRVWKASELKEVFIELTKQNSPTTNTYYRPFIYRSDISLSPELQGDYEFTLYMMPLGDYFDKSRGLNVEVSSWFRNTDNAIPPRTKGSGGYLNSALAVDTAKSKGLDSAIMLDGSGHVTEGAVMNLFMVRNGKIITTPNSADILEGITRKTVFQIAEDEGIEIVERMIDRSELYVADEVFFSGTATELTWCQFIDGLEVTSEMGEVTSKISDRFTNIVKGSDRLSEELFEIIEL